MEIVSIKYGSKTFNIKWKAGYSLLEPTPLKELDGEAIAKKLTAEAAGISFSRMAATARKVLFVVPDYTRVARCDQALPPLLQILHQAGLKKEDITFIIAAGTHRPMEREEIACIAGLDIMNSYRFLQHNSRDKDQLRQVCTTRRGTSAELNKIIFEHDLVVTIGAINAHYFAGFGGGRKMIFPGLAGREGIIANHLLSIDFQKGAFAQGIAPCNLVGNPVHEDMLEVVSNCPPHFSVNTLLTEKNELADVFCGDWLAAHREAAQAFMQHHAIPLYQQFDAVIASCGGYPKDTDLVQAHKSLFHASMALKPGGKLLLLAECIDGLGTKGFDENFPISNTVEYCQNLLNGKTKNGQTALSLHQKAQDYEVMMLSTLPDSLLSDIGIMPCASFDDGMKWIGTPGNLAVMPKASITVPVLSVKPILQ